MDAVLHKPPFHLNSLLHLLPPSTNAPKMTKVRTSINPGEKSLWFPGGTCQSLASGWRLSPLLLRSHSPAFQGENKGLKLNRSSDAITVKKPWLEGRKRQGGTSTTAWAPGMAKGKARSTTTAPWTSRGAQGLLAAHPTCPRAPQAIPTTRGLGSSGRPKHLWGPQKIRWNERLK